VTGTDAVRQRRILGRFLLAEFAVLSLPAAPSTDHVHVLRTPTDARGLLIQTRLRSYNSENTYL
jgi:hypothetical protein